MCLAVMLERGGTITRQFAEQAARNNPDGFGYAFVQRRRSGRQGNEVVIRKAAKYADICDGFFFDLARYGQGSPFVVHWRFATHGAISDAASHPYRMRDGGAIIHNGVIPLPVNSHVKSDTKIFVDKVLSHLPRGWKDRLIWRDVVTEYVGPGNKLVGIWPDRSTLIINEDKGSWVEDKVWVSNESYKPGFGWSRSFAYYGDTFGEFEDSATCELPTTRTPLYGSSEGNYYSYGGRLLRIPRNIDVADIDQWVEENADDLGIDLGANA